ncbi:MAG: response regulator transcription factor [Oscillospiraceae bacterium]|nr:response regulator transcription factor [Oscillospiraceae bacterium]MBQ5323956.1 response regulator transcription factor [Oscillospiraceae bacterium]
MYRILVCDDEEGIRTLISKYAKYEGYSVDTAENGDIAVQKCRQGKYDIVVMDIMMPYLDGFSAAKEIRKFSQVPIIMLTARGEEYDRIHGFEIGADDYVVKPFSPKELMMRIEVIMRRVANKKSDGHETYSKDGLVIDFTARKVIIDGQEVVLAPKEYELLFYLVRNKGIAVSRESLLTDIWGYEFFGDDRTLDTHIKLLRKHIGDYSSLIVTLRGIGYRFEG